MSLLDNTSLNKNKKEAISKIKETENEGESAKLFKKKVIFQGFLIAF